MLPTSSRRSASGSTPAMHRQHEFGVGAVGLAAPDGRQSQAATAPVGPSGLSAAPRPVICCQLRSRSKTTEPERDRISTVSATAAVAVNPTPKPGRPPATNPAGTMRLIGLPSCPCAAGVSGRYSLFGRYSQGCQRTHTRRRQRFTGVGHVQLHRPVSQTATVPGTLQPLRRRHRWRRVW